MTLSEESFDAAYFGDVESDLIRKSGYLDYLATKTNYIQKGIYEKFISNHGPKPENKILELGAGVGYFGKIARMNGLNVKCVDISQWCYDHRLHPDFVKASAFKYLKTLGSKSYDYIISFGFLECLDDAKLQALIILMNRVAKKQIHCLYDLGNPKYYNSKTIPQWKSFFDDSATIVMQGDYNSKIMVQVKKEKQTQVNEAS